jgi:hypothetical protein
MDSVTLGIVAYFVGLLWSVFYPYIVVYLESGENFNLRLVLSRILGIIMVGLAAIAAPGFVSELRDLAGLYEYQFLFFLSVFVATYGSGSIARTTEKLFSVVSHNIRDN